MALDKRRRQKCFQYYDCYKGFVIRAKSEKRAREIANESPGDEGSIWIDSLLTKCVELTAEGSEGKVLSDFHAG